MGNQFHYDSDLIGGSLMVWESRIVADLLINEVTTKQWDDAILRENVLQKRTPASAKRNATAIRKRLERLQPEFWEVIKDADDELAKQIAFCGALERNLLLVEFIETALRDAYLERSEKLDTFVWTDFLDDRAHRDPAILDWKESSRNKMGQVVFRILAEVGYLTNTRKRELQNVIVRTELRAMLDKYDKQRVKECLAVSAMTQSVGRSSNG